MIIPRINILKMLGKRVKDYKSYNTVLQNKGKRIKCRELHKSLLKKNVQRLQGTGEEQIQFYLIKEL